MRGSSSPRFPDRRRRRRRGCAATGTRRPGRGSAGRRCRPPPAGEPLGRPIQGLLQQLDGRPLRAEREQRSSHGNLRGDGGRGRRSPDPRGSKAAAGPFPCQCQGFWLGSKPGRAWPKRAWHRGAAGGLNDRDLQRVSHARQRLHESRSSGWVCRERSSRPSASSSIAPAMASRSRQCGGIASTPYQAPASWP